MLKQGIVSAALVVTTIASADSLPSNSKADEESGWWQSTHKTMSSKVGTWSKNLDLFFSGQRHDSMSDSFVSMRFGTILEEEDGVSGFFNLDARIDLPNTEERLNLIIESDADELTQDNRVTENETGQNILQSAQNTRFATMLRFFQEEWNANFDMGVLVRMPLDPFVRVRLKQDWEEDNWRIYQEESVFLYYTLGNGVRYSIEAERDINERYTFGAEFGVTYLELESDTYWRENLYVTQRLSDKSSMRYQLSYLQSGSRPQADSFLYFLKYKKLLHDNWLVGEIKPQFTHEAENDFEPEFSLSLSLEVLMGPDFL